MGQLATTDSVGHLSAGVALQVIVNPDRNLRTMHQPPKIITLPYSCVHLPVWQSQVPGELSYEPVRQSTSEHVSTPCY